MTAAAATEALELAMLWTPGNNEEAVNGLRGLLADIPPARRHFARAAEAIRWPEKFEAAKTALVEVLDTIALEN